MPEYSEKDIVIAKRGEAHEVWSARDFAPLTLVSPPDTNELKGRYWFKGGRATMVRKRITLDSCVGMLMDVSKFKASET